MNTFMRRLKDEKGVSTTVSVIIFIPLVIMFVGFLVNGAFFWVTNLYVQHNTNLAAKYTAVMVGDIPIPLLPDGQSNITPSEFLKGSMDRWPFVAETYSYNCRMLGGTLEANGVARCETRFQPLFIPTDPLTRVFFGVPQNAQAEWLSTTGENPNVQ